MSPTRLTPDAKTLMRKWGQPCSRMRAAPMTVPAACATRVGTRGTPATAAMKPPSRLTALLATRTATGVAPAPVRLRVVVARDDTAGEVVMGDGGGTVAKKSTSSHWCGNVGEWGSGGGETDEV